MKRLCIFTISVFCSLYPLGAIGIDECFALIDVFRSSPAEIGRMMDGCARASQADPSDPGAKLALAILCVALDTREGTGRAEHAKEALGYAEDFLRVNPDNDLGLLFDGIARSLDVRGSRNPFYQMSEMKKAIASLDRAVEASKGGPREWYVRFMRANTYANTPRSMGKWGAAEEDYLFLLDFVKDHPEREPYLVPAYYYRALMKKADGDMDSARSCLRRALDIERVSPSDAPEAALAEGLLAKLEKAKK